MSNQLHRYRIVLDYIEPWLDEQDEATLKQIYADLLVLEKEGPSLGRPLVDRVKGSKLHHLKELRVTSCGGQDLAALMAFGRADEAVGQTSAFATSVREATREMLVELGCAVGPWSDMVADRATRTERPRIRLPWSREGDQR